MNVITKGPYMSNPWSQDIRGMLGSKYGKAYLDEASSDEWCSKWRVNQNLIRCAPRF